MYGTYRTRKSLVTPMFTQYFNFVISFVTSRSRLQNNLDGARPDDTTTRDGDTPNAPNATAHDTATLRHATLHILAHGFVCNREKLQNFAHSTQAATICRLFAEIYLGFRVGAVFGLNLIEN